MSTPLIQISTLESRAHANTQLLSILEARQQHLLCQAAQQHEELSRFEQEFACWQSSRSSSCPSTKNITRTTTIHPAIAERAFEPLHNASRKAQFVTLSFVIAGPRGEAVRQPLDRLSMAFVLHETLVKKGWTEDNVRRGVLGFLETPMMEVQWRGEAARLGRLDEW